jgi:hypothetical protein
MSSDVRFMHIRKFTPQGGISNLGGATVAYTEVHSGVCYAVAKCSALDNFSKVFGRMKSAGRLHSDSYRNYDTVTLDEFEDMLLAGEISL